VGRWGGDEFLAIVPNVNHATLTKLVSRCVVMVANISLAVSDGVTLGLSISAGATLAHPGETGEDLIQRVDDLMYRSKTSCHGRALTL
jgi:diguanylate cyclase (GGDEF)-like protein